MAYTFTWIADGAQPRILFLEPISFRITGNRSGNEVSSSAVFAAASNQVHRHRSILPPIHSCHDACRMPSFSAEGMA